MCPSETITFNPAPVDQESARQRLAATYTSHSRVVTETCHRMEADMDWLAAEPRAESMLLLHYFSDRVSRIKDLFEYRESLAESLDQLASDGRMIQVVADLDYILAASWWKYFS